MPKLKDIIYVSLQAVLFVFYVIPVQIEVSLLIDLSGWFWWIFIGIGVIIGLLALLQLKTNLSPFPSPKHHSTLITSGVFKYIRHPIYTAILMVCFSYAMLSSNGWKLMVTIGLFVLFWLKSNYEEQLLQKKIS
ncbi:methyltransferase family protein [Psychroflexus sp. ALD_RP9]|uniref:methyltransferase family protein n=1 Tax=Psychroflexus sp. ALD_RP9 TaxID=2777186 RepID=UPI001A8DEBF0|nr:methyltransferase [Psychroflexus sp. ALD_RP9]QSS97437.1 DUF1295 domain-containing protein [Psychroflexus sp. ALD_RP9]